MTTIETETIGEAWLEAARRILADGADATYDGAATRELTLLSLAVSAPSPDDVTIAALADPEWLEWMRRNFTEPDDVPELGGARSYARRLRDFYHRFNTSRDLAVFFWMMRRLLEDHGSLEQAFISGLSSDDVDTGEMLEMLLSSEGYHVLWAQTGAEGLRLVEQEPVLTAT